MLFRSRQVIGVLENPEGFAHLGAAARQRVIERYDLKTRCLPELLKLIDA